MSIQSVPLAKAYRLLNHGPTVLVSAQHGDSVDVMAAAWACALDFSPAKVTVVLDKSTYTRVLIEQSGQFVLQIPTRDQAPMVLGVGTQGLQEHPDKLNAHGVQLFHHDAQPLPLVQGCSAWLVCRLLPEPHNHAAHDLFIGEVVAAYAEDEVFRDGHWHFESADAKWRSLHYVAGGQFYVIGDSLNVSAATA